MGDLGPTPGSQPSPSATPPSAFSPEPCSPPAPATVGFENHTVPALSLPCPGSPLGFSRTYSKSTSVLQSPEALGSARPHPAFSSVLPASPPLTGLQLLPPQGLCTTVSWPGMISSPRPYSHLCRNATPWNPAGQQSLASPLALLITALPTRDMMMLRSTALWLISYITIWGIGFLVHLPSPLQYRLHVHTRPLLGALPMPRDSEWMQWELTSSRAKHHGSPGAAQAVPHRRQQRTCQGPSRHES